ncbi:MAG TPA: DEAD/DEAH box helicase [Mycobacteriales bacterium]|nr:DEAD/DEAH box helicase [Mycobacteriales bacterium]
MDANEVAERHLTGVLAGMAGPGAVPRPDQVEAVAALAAGRRVLLVQATGWGKSAAYWAATAALREAGHGPTLVISPLLALMRDQVTAAGKAGLRAATVNSANVEDWQVVFDALGADEVDVLLVSPERLANPKFADRALPLLAKTGLLVVDEAHCISDWGFDFRPDYQRLTHLLAATTPGSPVLATTATANARVTADVAAQLGDDTLVLRGPLARASLRLAVAPGLDGVERFAWVADALDTLPGSGIVYALTVDQTESLAGFLAAQGHPVAAYTGQTEPDERARIEAALRANELKAVVATSALGMGYDKPDLGFCVHVGSPDSPVAYYQQVGRAGRALDEAVGVLLPAAESDPRIWEWFATATIPDPDAAARVLRVLPGPDGAAMSVPAIEAETGLRRGRLDALLKTLRVDGAVDRVGTGWVATGEPWQYDADKYGRVVAARRAEADLMREYAAGARCLMQVLTEALDDPTAGPCGRCSVCTGVLPAPGARPAPERVLAARRHLRGRRHVLEPRKLWPSGGGRKGRIVGLAPGRAIAFADDPAWRDLIAEVGGPDGEPSDELRAALVDVLSRWSREWDERPLAVIPVPSRSRPRRVQGMAEHIATIGRLPLVDAISVTGTAPADEVSSGVRVRQLFDGLRLLDGIALPPGPVLLVDDLARSTWTITACAALLHDAGTGPVLPLVAHRRP